MRLKMKNNIFDKLSETPVEQFNEARDYAFHYLSYRPRSVLEIARRLKQRGYDSNTVTMVVEHLQNYKFLDDEAFTKMWIQSRLNYKPSGRRKIYGELLQKGIDREIIERHLSEITMENEELLAMALISKKCSKAILSYKKLEGFLIRRGFGSEIVRKVLTGHQEPDVK